MVEGEIKIFLSYKEPEYRDNIMWLRPYLDREGFELLYYGANGWTVFIPCYSHSNKHCDDYLDKSQYIINDCINNKCNETI